MSLLALHCIRCLAVEQGEPGFLLCACVEPRMRYMSSDHSQQDPAASACTLGLRCFAGQLVWLDASAAAGAAAAATAGPHTEPVEQEAAGAAPAAAPSAQPGQLPTATAGGVPAACHVAPPNPTGGATAAEPTSVPAAADASEGSGEGRGSSSGGATAVHVPELLTHLARGHAGVSPLEDPDSASGVWVHGSALQAVVADVLEFLSQRL